MLSGIDVTQPRSLGKLLGTFCAKQIRQAYLCKNLMALSQLNATANYFHRNKIHVSEKNLPETAYFVRVVMPSKAFSGKRFSIRFETQQRRRFLETEYFVLVARTTKALSGKRFFKIRNALQQVKFESKRSIFYLEQLFFVILLRR